MAVCAHPLDSGNQLRFIERFEVLVLFHGSLVGAR